MLDRHPRLLRRQDTAAADEDGDVTQWCVDRDILAWSSGDGGLVVPVVPDFSGADAREDAGDGGGALGEDGGDEEVGAEEELRVDCRELGVVGELK